MIYSNDKSQLDGLDERMKECITYAKKVILADVETGSYLIDGKDLFVNVVSYETKAPEQCFWEAHKEYIDLHYMLEGIEQIDLGLIYNMEQKQYVAESDFLPIEGNKSASVMLTPGDYLICYPEDAHMTAIQVGEQKKIKKAIFKIRT